MQDIFTYKFGWRNTVERKNLNNLGEIIANDATVVAGYQFTITFVRHRDLMVGYLPEILTTSTTGNVKYDTSIL
jgi:hypothetical protein